MKHLKSFKQFEDVATATTAGMGAVSSAQPSSNAGSLNGSDFSNGGGTVGSGDVSNNLLSKKKRKIGNAREVSDMRFLGPDKIGGKFPIKK